ncbi:MAG: peptidase and chymotrypsin/Hap [Verrucomicrobiales bacterium]|nr:peptidase and chymotrypsin/Hap [Verrucomicrobiales bacterium]
MIPRPFFLSRVLLPAVLLQAAFLPLQLQAETLKERQTRVLEAVQKVGPTVVAITGASAKGSMGSGSGVIISKDGLVLTAGHVLAATGEDLIITLPGGREVKGKSLGRDMNRDAALAKITDPGDYTFADMADPSSIEKGEWVVALGHPGGYDPQRGAPLRVGRLWDVDNKTFYRSDCTVSGGDSGGPLFDLSGKVIGIHSSISQNLSENRHVPIGVFEKDMERLKNKEVWGKLSNIMPGMRDEEEDNSDQDKDLNRPRARPKKEPGSRQKPAPRTEPEEPAAPAAGRAYMGATLQMTDEGQVRVEEIADGSPAAQAGLQLEDIITKAGGKEIASNSDIVAQVRAAKPGDMLKLTIRRKGADKELEVKLAPAP